MKLHILALEVGRRWNLKPFLKKACKNPRKEPEQKAGNIPVKTVQSLNRSR
jgi:hypothetical protein